eukprot:1613352-Rhodomonas_salina.1
MHVRDRCRAIPSNTEQHRRRTIDVNDRRRSLSSSLALLYLRALSLSLSLPLSRSLSLSLVSASCSRSRALFNTHHPRSGKQRRAPRNESGTPVSSSMMPCACPYVMAATERITCSATTDNPQPTTQSMLRPTRASGRIPAVTHHIPALPRHRIASQTL